MPKVSQQQTNARREEIINACAKLYETTCFKQLTLKDVADATSFTRTSIYNYFQTKEEIFLALLEREYDLWNADLEGILQGNDSLTAEQFADKLARSLQERSRLLKILSTNHYDMEGSSRIQNLTQFKRSYGRALELVGQCLKKFFPAMDGDGVNNFIYIFFPYMFGIYPYTYVTPKQLEAMKQAGVHYAPMDIYGLAYACAYNLLKA